MRRDSPKRNSTQRGKHPGRCNKSVPRSNETCLWRIIIYLGENHGTGQVCTAVLEFHAIFVAMFGIPHASAVRKRACVTYRSSAAVRSSDSHQAIVHTRGVSPDAIDGGAERRPLGEIEGCSKNRHDLSGRNPNLQHDGGQGGPVEGIVSGTQAPWGFVPWVETRNHI